MYVLPKSVSSKATGEPSAPFWLSIRVWLLIWASLRLAVSVLWTGLIVRATYKTFDYFLYQRQATYITEAPNVLAFSVFATGSQLVELTMIVLFIVAGFKKCAHLYFVYYRYCILTLMIYIIAMILCFTLSYEDGHYYGEVYLTYHINDLPIMNENGLVFGIIAILDICLEVLLINLIKKMMNKYSQVNVNVTCERV